MSEPKEFTERYGDYSCVIAGEGYRRPGKVLCNLTNTGNGYIACFPASNCTRQDHYVCLDYSQAHDLILALSAFKKELGFVEPEAPNFCPRCGKRAQGVLGQSQVHTCTPPLWGRK